MRRLAWLLALFGLLGAPALADVSVGNGSIGVPLVCAQGGTGQTSYTAGDILYASASCTISKLSDVATGSVLVSGGVGAAPAWTSAPAFSGANITTGTIPTSALVTAPLSQTCTTTTYTDQSGASLSITNNGTQYYCKEGTDATAWFDITYPANASGAAAAVSLPFTCQSVNFGGWMSKNTLATALGVMANGTTFGFPSFTSAGGGNNANSTLTLGHLIGGVSCYTTS